MPVWPFAVLVVLAGSVLSAGPACAAAEPGAGTITLPNRQVTPEPGLEEDLRAKLDDPDRTALNGLVMLPRVPDPEMRSALSGAGVSLRQFLGGTSYLAGFSSEATAEEVERLVLWAGLLRPEDKMQPAVWRGDLEDWAVEADGRIKLLVHFYERATFRDVEKLLSAFTEDYRRHGPGDTWAIVVDRDRLSDLAGLDAVRWIEQGPDPMMPLEGDGLD